MLPDFEMELEWKGKRYKDVDRGLRAFAESIDEDMEKFRPIVLRELRKYMDAVVKSVRARTATPWPGGTSAAGQFPGTLSKRSGELNQSLDPNKAVISAGEDPSVSFTLTGIAAVHERGATIRAKNAQYLTIPLPAALDGRGVPKRPTARSWPNTFIQRSRKGNLLIFQKRGPKEIIPLYVLKKSVRIPRRLAFQEAFEAGRDMLADRLAAELIKEFNRA